MCVYIYIYIYITHMHIYIYIYIYIYCVFPQASVEVAGAVIRANGVVAMLEALSDIKDYCNVLYYMM